MFDYGTFDLLTFDLGPLEDQDEGSLAPSLYVDTDTFYTQAITTGVVTLSPSLYIDNETFYTQTISAEAEVFFLHPDADDATGNWTDELDGTTDIFESIDEDSPADDDDYVQSPIVGGTTADLFVRLLEGSTEIVEWEHEDVSSSFTTATQELTEEQFDAISDFSNLFIELDDNSGNVYKIRISDPTNIVAPPFKVHYRYRKLA